MDDWGVGASNNRVRPVSIAVLEPAKSSETGRLLPRTLPRAYGVFSAPSEEARAVRPQPHQASSSSG